MHSRPPGNLYAVTNVSIGVWSAGRKTRKLLLSLPDRKLFVLVIVHGSKQSKNGALSRALEQVNHLLDRRNPFSTLSPQGGRHAILALELEWDAVVGADFLFPLHQDARLVLESRVLTKRLFHTMADVEHFYGWRSHVAGRSTAGRASWHHDPRLSRLNTSISRRTTLTHQVQAHQHPCRPPQQNVQHPETPTAAQLEQSSPPSTHTQGQLAQQGLMHRQLSAPSHLMSGQGRRSGRRQRSLKARQVQVQLAAAAAAPPATCGSPSAAGASTATEGGGSGSAAGAAVYTGTVGEASARAGAAALRLLRGPRCEGLQQHLSEPCPLPELPRDLAEAFALAGSLPPCESKRSGEGVAASEQTQEAVVDVSCEIERKCGGAAGPPSGDARDGKDTRARAAPTTASGTGACAKGSTELKSGQGSIPLPGHQASTLTPAPGQVYHVPLPSRHLVSHGHSGSAAANADHPPSSVADRPSPDVPSAARWTAAAAQYPSRTIIVNFRDALLTQDLRVFVQSDMRLLKLYESGLPAWAIFLPSYGLPYRPWMRRATWLLWVILSFVSMAFGFYDLYKNIPYVKAIVTAVLARIHLPATALFEWLEHHTQIRLSILLGWLFSRSPLFAAALRALRSATALASQLLAPLSRALAPAAAAAVAALVSALQPIVQPIAWACSSSAVAVAAAVSLAGRAVWKVGSDTWQLVGDATGWVFGPVVQLLAAFLQLLAAAGLAAHNALLFVAVGPLMLLTSLVGAAFSLGQLVQGALGPLGTAAWQLALALRSAWGPAAAVLASLLGVGRAALATVVPSLRLARTAAGSASAIAAAAGSGTGGVASASSWLWAELPYAQDLVISTGSRCLKGAQAVTNFLVTWAMAISRHRVSLLLQAKQALPLPLGPVPLQRAALITQTPAPAAGTAMPSGGVHRALPTGSPAGSVASEQTGGGWEEAGDGLASPEPLLRSPDARASGGGQRSLLWAHGVDDEGLLLGVDPLDQVASFGTWAAAVGQPDRSGNGDSVGSPTGSPRLPPAWGGFGAWGSRAAPLTRLPAGGHSRSSLDAALSRLPAPVWSPASVSQLTQVVKGPYQRTSARRRGRLQACADGDAGGRLGAVPAGAVAAASGAGSEPLPVGTKVWGSWSSKGDTMSSEGAAAAGASASLRRRLVASSQPDLTRSLPSGWGWLGLKGGRLGVEGDTSSSLPNSPQPGWLEALMSRRFAGARGPIEGNGSHRADSNERAASQGRLDQETPRVDAAEPPASVLRSVDGGQPSMGPTGRPPKSKKSAGALGGLKKGLTMGAGAPMEDCLNRDKRARKADSRQASADGVQPGAST